MSDARKAALLVLEKCRRSGAWSDAVLGSILDAQKIQGRDRGLASALSYGVMQNRMLLDWVIGSFSSIELKKIEPKVLDLLRMGAYQILLMDRIPASAAVNSAVRLSRELGFDRASGFINALLRRLSTENVQLPEGKDAQSLSIRWSHPLWLTELYIKQLGTEEAISLLQTDNDTAPITLQTNTLRTSTEKLLNALAAQGLRCHAHPSVPDCIILESGAVQLLPEYERGEFYVQDAAAKMAVIAAAPKSGQSILDACAAPGGKSFAAAILSGGARIVACDLHEKKLKRIEESAKRLGLGDVSLRAQDARVYLPEFEQGFDLVIADVPCSGLGVIRKKPDIRYKDPKEFDALPAIQTAILRNVSRYVKPGGTLLYSTCTIRPEENFDVCAAFLRENTEFTCEDFNLPDGGKCSGGMLQLWPQRNGTDGFFIAKMKKWNKSI